jgi:hypothetical protein
MRGLDPRIQPMTRRVLLWMAGQAGHEDYEFFTST